MKRHITRMFSIALAITLLPMTVMAQLEEVEKKLVAAATAGSLTEIQQLVTKDVDLSKSNALTAAVGGGHLDVVKYLIEKGADPNKLLMRNGFTSPPMFKAAKEGRPEILEYVVAHGANLNYERPGATSVITTPLIAAVYYGDLDTARLLIKYGADVNYVSSFGNTALIQAIHYAGGDGTDDMSDEFIELFLSNGANPDIHDRNGITARQYAKSSQHAELSALIEKAKPAQPGSVQASASDLGAVAMVLQTKDTCDQILPGFREKSAAVYQAWRDKNAPLIAQIEDSPAFKEQIAHAKAGVEKSLQTEPRAVKERGFSQIEEICEYELPVELAVDRSSGPHPKLATPELTWAHYLESLRKGDRDAALSCLSSTARSKFRKHIKNGSDEQLRRMEDSIKSFKITGQISDDLVEGVAARHDGRAGMIYFQNVNGEWMITEM